MTVRIVLTPDFTTLDQTLTPSHTDGGRLQRQPRPRRLLYHVQTQIRPSARLHHRGEAQRSQRRRSRLARTRDLQSSTARQRAVLLAPREAERASIEGQQSGSGCLLPHTLHAEPAAFLQHCSEVGGLQIGEEPRARGV